MPTGVDGFVGRIPCAPKDYRTRPGLPELKPSNTTTETLLKTTSHRLNSNRNSKTAN